MQKTALLFLAIFFVFILRYFFRHIRWLKKAAQQRALIHSFEAFEKLQRSEFTASGLAFPLVLASPLTACIVLVGAVSFLGLSLAVLTGFRLDANMDVTANVIFNAVFAFFAFLGTVYFLKTSTVVILDHSCINFNDHFDFMIFLGTLRSIPYGEIEHIEARLLFGSKRAGTLSVGVNLTIRTKGGSVVLKPNILYNNETLLLLVGLKEKVGDRLTILSP